MPSENYSAKMAPAIMGSPMQGLDAMALAMDPDPEISMEWQYMTPAEQAAKKLAWMARQSAKGHVVGPNAGSQTRGGPMISAGSSTSRG